MKDIISNKNLLFTSLGFFWLFFGFAAAQQYLVPLLELQGRGEMALSVLLVLYTSFLISSIFISKIIYLFGLKLSLILGALTYLLFSLSVIINNNLIIFLAAFLLGIGAALVWVSVGQVIKDSSTEKTIGRNLGFQAALFYLGTILGISSGGLLLKYFSMQLLYAYFSIAIILCLPCFLKISDLKGSIPNKKFNPYLIFKLKFLLLFPLIFSTYYFITQTFSSINLLILQLFGIVFIGILITIFRISMMFGVFTIGKISDLYNKEKTIYVVIIVGLVGIILLYLTHNIFSVTIGLILLGLFGSSSYPICISLFKKSSSSGEFLSAMGIFVFYNNVATVSALLATKYFNSQYNLVLGLTFLLLSFPAVYLFSRKYSKA